MATLVGAWAGAAATIATELGWGWSNCILHGQAGALWEDKWQGGVDAGGQKLWGSKRRGAEAAGGQAEMGDWGSIQRGGAEVAGVGSSCSTDSNPRSEPKLKLQQLPTQLLLCT